MFDSYDPITFEPKNKLSEFFSWFGGPLQFFAFIVTVIGSFLVAQLSQNLRFYGFLAWFCSNLLWMVWAISSKGRVGVLLTYVTNFLLTLMGIINNWPS